MVGVLKDIVDCGIKDCAKDGRRPHDHEMNPRSQAIKGPEMALLRCLQLIELWLDLDKGQDWTDAEMSAYRKILGNDHYAQRAMISEVWRRFQSGVLYLECLSLFDNLPPAVQKRTEIKDGIRIVRKELHG